MKKHLIAAAVAAAVAVPAAAQVTVYGSFDTGFSSIENKQAGTTDTLKATKASGFNATSEPLTSSRLGFRGSEDIGGGLKAQFNLEYGFAPGSGTLTTTNIRTSTVGVSGGFGTINIGRHLTGVHGVVAGFNSVLAGSNMVGDVLYSGAYRMHSGSQMGVDFKLNQGDASGLRANNMLSYTSPAFAGFTARVDVARDASDADSASASDTKTKTDVTGLRLDYAAGKFKIAAATLDIKTKAAVAGAKAWVCSPSTVGTAASDVVTSATACASPNNTVFAGNLAVTASDDERKFTVDAVSAQYDLGMAAVDVTFAQNKYFTEGTGDTHESDGYRVGVTVPMGAMTLAAHIGSADVKKPSAGTSADRDAYQLAAVYSLSKRTNVYAVYGSQEQEQGANKYETKAWALGLRHSF